MHYAGRAPGPVKPFAFDVGDFAVESINMLMADPYLVTARAQVSLPACLPHRFPTKSRLRRCKRPMRD